MTNIALVVLDTLRKDAFDEHFDWLPGRRFENAYSTSHWTVPAHASLFTGKYASEVGVYAGSQHLDFDEPVLAERLQDSGYKTRAISANVNVSPIYDFDRGFDEFTSIGRHNRQLQQVSDPDLFDWSAYAGGEAGVREYVRAIRDCVRSDCDTLRSLRHGLDLKLDLAERFGSGMDDMGAQRVLNIVQDTDFGDREFMYVNLMETHSPYAIPDSYRSSYEFASPDNPADEVADDMDLKPLRDRYKEAADYLSDIYRDIFMSLRNDFDLIITVSDHGELLGEHGRCFHMSGLYPELTNIPLSIYMGRGGRGEGHHGPVSLVDVHRTIEAASNASSVGPRGSDLREDLTEERKILTEYHGVAHPDRVLDDLREWLGSDEAIDEFQEWRRGIAFDSFYGYETMDGFRSVGSPSGNSPVKMLEEAVAGLNVRLSDSQTGGEISEGVREELEHLGYV